MAVRGHGVLDFIARTYRNNRALLKERKPLKKIYEENNLHSIKKKVDQRTRKFDPEKRRVFLEKFHARQRRTQRRLAFLLMFVISMFSLILYLIFELIDL